MDPARWRRVSALFEQAVALPASERTAFLHRACDSDDDRREVESLLGHHAEGEGVLDDGAGRLAADLMRDGGLVPGQMLGAYRVVRELGRGGMGVVYLAQDTRLGRAVAIKMLAGTAMHDERRRARLRQEARAAAAVPHPGIAQVYALEEDARGVGYVVSEYVDGHTLREELDAGALAPDVAMSTAVQIAGAVAAAHARGIAHRDLKPENVMRAVDGTVKVLDFGLARLTDPALNEARTRLTMTGVMMGTPAYMSPEQLRGADSGAPSDVFSLGLLLHEMLTGRHAFAADGAGTVARILEGEPNALPRHVTAALPGIDEVVDRCLEKDVAARYPSMADVMSALEGIREESTSAVPDASGRAAALSFSRARPSALNWWLFHQLVVCGVYVAMIVPAWRLRGAPLAAWAHNLLVLAVIVPAAVTTTLRLHGVFTARVHPHRLRTTRRRAHAWTRAFDWMMSGALLAAAAAALLRDQVWFAALFVSVAASATVTFLFIEPATAEASFREGPR